MHQDSQNREHFLLRMIPDIQYINLFPITMGYRRPYYSRPQIFFVQVSLAPLSSPDYQQQNVW